MIVGLIRCIDHSFPPLPAKTSHPLMSRSDKCGNSLNPTMHYSNMAIKRVMQHSSPLFSDPSGMGIHVTGFCQIPQALQRPIFSVG